ncbi:hypothetical protein BJY21_001439 [Kineosphaera limosa]|uniref:Pyruvate phosphate dikinase AMP/ATP-binding domain-containing protein n=1 Tax=Kineosphaera limosa NBRC 100340 TaxID=1184609 RepID=K6VP86_9MICO|nr:PEP/pyruvate-binding domain-containing protein [Kineosphaera limosa]NYE00255.1 hypothetical protein [Kineosphaera limosa]GAB98033.1 hypothetical protein KILIM_095_00110 [Kineosphaera limosa NBRC 100340]
METVSTGHPGLDSIIDGLRLGDNVVWRVDSLEDFAAVAAPFVAQARADGRRIVHVRFGHRDPLPEMESRLIDPSLGFERCAMAVHDALTEIGPLGFYVFDPLADLHQHWQSDLMVMNFFKATCPYLYSLDTIAYFPLLRDRHTPATVAGVRDTTQLLLDLHHIDDELYVHPLKVWERHSPTMFFPHRLADSEAISITSSHATSRLFSTLARPVRPREPWLRRIDEAWAALDGDDDAQRRARDQLRAMLVGPAGRMAELAETHLTLTDLLAVASRQLGTGAIGGKSVGMLVARAILEHDPEQRFSDVLEPHDSYYLGADAFLSFLIINGWWPLWSEHKQHDYYGAAQKLQPLIASGRFSRTMRGQFLAMLEYFGQAPLIVRSSSLLEDNFGNAFAGKYDSVFLPNQGSPEERLAALEAGFKQVYASALSEPALRYREDRGLSDQNEQMAVLIQRVSGDHHEGMFLPDAAGVANSSSLYAWKPDLADRGMVRLVVGLGTRAVDRTGGDFARIVALADPLQSPVSADDAGRYSQRRVDALDLASGTEVTLPWGEVRRRAPGMPWRLLLSPDHALAERQRERGRSGPPPELIDFAGLLRDTDFAATLDDLLVALSTAYGHPVDVEFTVNLDRDGVPRVNVVQCRPLQTRGSGPAVATPRVIPQRCVLATDTFLGGNARLPLDLVVSVRAETYLRLGQPDRYSVARMIGKLNRALSGRSAMLIGPGRWGTTTPSLGVPVHFSEINRFAVLCETTYSESDFRPELSYGSHFFQELVEVGMLYAAVFDDRGATRFQPELLARRPNRLTELLDGSGDAAQLADVIHVADTDGLLLHSDVVSQQFVVQFE